MENLLKPELTDKDTEAYSTLALAYLGDGVFELMARTHLALCGSLSASGLHKKAVGIVCAGMQAKAARSIKAELSADELAVFLRGRNAKPKTLPKHSERSDYSYATALEAVFGWLFLKGDTARINELFQAVLKLEAEIILKKED